MNGSLSRARCGLAVLLSIVALIALMGSPASAQRRYPPGPPQVLPTVITRGGGPQADVGGSVQAGQETKAEGDVLPFTGADLTLFVVGGMTAIAAGTTLVRANRRRSR